MPSPILSAADAAAIVVKHLDNRTRSRESRMLNHSGSESDIVVLLRAKDYRHGID